MSLPSPVLEHFVMRDGTRVEVHKVGDSITASVPIYLQHLSRDGDGPSVCGQPCTDPPEGVPCLLIPCPACMRAGFSLPLPQPPGEHDDD